MLKTFFVELLNIFKYSGTFLKEVIKKQGIIWLLIFLQMVIVMPLAYFYGKLEFAALSNLNKFLICLGGVVLAVLFFFMFKIVYDMASIGFKKEKISYLRIFLSLLLLGIINCSPWLFLNIMYKLSTIFPAYAVVFKMLLNVLSCIFYFAFSLSLASIVKWSEKNIFVALLNGIKTFLSKIGLVILVVSACYLLAKIIAFLLCTIIYAIAIYFNFIDEAFAFVVQTAVNFYSLYIIAALYIGAQIKVLGIEENEKPEENTV